MALAAALAGAAACSSNGNPMSPTTELAGGSAAATAGAEVNQQVAQLRAITAKYHNIDKAIADGFVEITPCLSSPAGGMGFHYAIPSRIEDGVINLVEPEVLVYAPGPNGQLKLVAVEYIVPEPIWPGGAANPPSLFGHPFHAGPPPLLVLHAWVWKHNPAGMFEDWNPTVSCPS
jgi:hypothetical protein